MTWDIKKIKQIFLISGFPILLALNTGFSADDYEIDVTHTHIGFSVKHMVVTTVKGNFTDFSGSISVDKNDLSKSWVKVKIKTTSINTNMQKRDDHLRSADFFNVEKFPEIKFESKSIQKKGDGYIAKGTLSMHGVSKEVSIPFTFAGPIKNPWGKYVIGIEGSLTINREDYGLTYNSILESGGVLIGKEIKIELNVEAVRK
ncbi:MAG: polyisoprenoid-binding protein [Fibrobacteria bacterium]|nr:polyisoprenoid-binding protein [Fibrobacteria bacterium]